MGSTTITPPHPGAAALHPAALSINTVQDPGAFVLAPAGEVDEHSLPVLRAAIQRAEHSPCPQLVIDLAAVRQLHLAAVELLRDLEVRCRHSGRQLTLLPGPRQVQRMLERYRLPTAAFDPAPGS